MERDQIIKEHILRTGLLSQEQVARAEDYAITMKLPLDESIIFLQLMDLHTMGKVCEEVYGIPYKPLLNGAPPDEAMKAIPVSIAEKLTIFPVDFDAESQAFVIAVQDPTDQTKNEQLTRLLSPKKVNFVVASYPEITRAIETFYKGKTYNPDIQVELPKGFKIVVPKAENAPLGESLHKGRQRALLLEPDLQRYRAIRALLSVEGIDIVAWARTPEEISSEDGQKVIDTILVNGEVYKPGESWIKHLTKDSESMASFYYPRSMLLGQQLPYGAVSEALISLVAFVVKKALKKDPSRLQETISRVRYCKLLSLKLELTPAQIDSVVLAAWLSTSKLGNLIAQQIQTPYGLNDIISATTESRPSKKIEAEILSLVATYQEIKKSRPNLVRDIEGIRKSIGACTANRTLLQCFLQVIRDEGLLQGIGEGKRRILMIGPGFHEHSELVLCLQSEGYRVSRLRDPSKAMEKISSSIPDLLLCEINNNQKAGLNLCTDLREHPKASRVPVFFIAPKEAESLAAECLKAGADDFITQPVEPDILILKIKRALNSFAQKQSRKGIEGSLEEMSAMDIIQSVATGEKNVKITLESNGHMGSIFIKGGEIIHAETDNMEGQEALFRLMTFQHGEFRVVSCSSFPHRTIHGSTMSLLMEGARLVDEANAGTEV